VPTSASCASPLENRLPSTDYGPCGSATATPPRQLSCCSARDQTTSHTVSSARSSRQARQRPRKGHPVGEMAEPRLGHLTDALRSGKSHIALRQHISRL